MILFKNNILTTKPFTIDTADYIMELTPDVLDCEYFGILTLSNKTTKTIQFIRFNTIFKARLIISEEELPLFNNVSFKLLSVSSSFSKESNSINLNLDTNKIKLTIKQSVSKEMSELKKSLIQLQTKVETLSLGKLVPTVNIANKDYIKPGMILVAIDNGNFMAAYPFADIVKEVNGQHAVDGVVEIDASMIKYNIERNVEQQLKIMGEAILNQNDTIKTLAGELINLSQRVADISIKLETHLDNGIL
jgi:hypothetical protein